MYLDGSRPLWTPLGEAGLMLAALVGLSMLLAVVGGTATLAACLLARRLRARQAQRHPQQAAAKERTRQARRLAAEWAPARPNRVSRRGAMVGFCPGQTMYDPGGRLDRGCCRWSWAAPSAEESRELQAVVTAIRPDDVKYHNQGVTRITDDRPK